MWDEYKALIREAFAGEADLPFQEKPSLPADLDAGVAIGQIRATRPYAADLVRHGARPVAAEIVVTLDWISLEKDGSAAEAAVEAAYFHVANVARARFGPDVTGCDRTESVIEPHSGEQDKLIGRETWTFGR